VESEAFDKIILLKMARKVPCNKHRHTGTYTWSTTIYRHTHTHGRPNQPRLSLPPLPPPHTHNTQVGAATLVNALAESVKPRLGKGSEAALTQFQDVLLAGLKGGEAETGKQFGFGVHGGSKLVVTINGKKQGEIASAPLSKALLRTYLDDNAVSKDLKESIATGILTFVNLGK
jgi:hypothetical protein